MSVGRVPALVLLFVASSLTYANSDADDIAHLLQNVDSVTFHFVTRTETYDYSVEKMKKESSIEMRRSCGANCHNFMGPVIDLLRESKPVECKAGQQDVLVSFGRHQLIYSYGGRLVRYQDRCYFNETGVQRVIERDRFIFD